MKKKLDSIFKWFCKPEYHDDIRGDLEELYEEKRRESSNFSADLYYLKEILLLLRISLMRPTLFHRLLDQRILLVNNFKTAARYIWFQKLFSMIKISGLSLGIAATLILSIYIYHQLSYDSFYQQKDQIYRLTAEYQEEGFSGVDFPAPLASTLVKDFPEVEQAGRMISSNWLRQVRPISKTHNFYEERIAMVDPELVELLGLQGLDASVVQAMQAPKTLVISKAKARKYFPGEDPIGQLLIINNDQEAPYQVVGVYEDFPPNSHLVIDLMITLSEVEFWPGERTYWGANMYSVYALLNKDAQPETLQSKLGSIIENYFLPSWQERNFADAREIADNIKLGLQPIQEIYLGPSEIRDDLKHGNIKLIWLFGISAFLIVIIAIINFINLSIARYTVRMKELSMRKILGATRSQLIQQFLTEFLLYSFLALVIGLAIAYLALPYFGQLMGQTLSFPISLLWGIPLFFLSILVITILAGTYPALFLSNVNPSSQKIQKKRGSFTQLLQQSLVSFQFIISATLIICTIAVLKQTQYILDKDLGFDKEQIVVVKGTNALGDKLPTFKKEIQQFAGVDHITVSDYLPIEDSRRYMDSFWEKGEESVKSGANAQLWQVDHDYINTLGIQLSQGRNFDRARSTDSTAIIISNSLASSLHLDEDLGALITNKERNWKVIGIIEDIHFESLRNDMTPLCLVLGDNSSMMAVKTHTSDPSQLLQSIENKWTQMVPSDPFRYEYLDESFAMMHTNVARSAKLFNIFSVLAIIIACLGLFGLSTFKAHQRERELGIRKILGANVSSIILLISKDYLFIIALANLLAIPIGWYLVRNILENFAYRVEISWPVFVIAAGLTLLIAIGTIGFQGLKAALKNPIESIREG